MIVIASVNVNVKGSANRNVGGDLGNENIEIEGLETAFSTGNGLVRAIAMSLQRRRHVFAKVRLSRHD